MTPQHLIQLFSQPPDGGMSLYGAYGSIHISPEPGAKTYTVECAYRVPGRPCVTKTQGGFRLSTACCLCACIIFGESAVNGELIETINTCLD